MKEGSHRNTVEQVRPKECLGLGLSGPAHTVRMEALLGHHLSLSSVAVINSTAKDNWKRVYLSLPSIIKGSQGRSMEALEEQRSPACPPQLAQPASVYNPGPHIRDGTIHSGMGPPVQVINQENGPQG